MFVRNAWYVAGWSHELTAAPLARRLLGEPLVMYRGQDGRAVALEDRCCHRGLPFSVGGQVEPHGIRCGYHGMVFDGSGRCVEIPGQAGIPPAACVRSYPVEERDRLVWIWMGDPAMADAAGITRYPWHDSWPHRTQSEVLACNYLLVSDNLLDQSHAAFVHKGTLASNLAAYGNVEMKTQATPNGVKFTRWMLDSEPPELYAKSVSFAGRVDRWQQFEYVSPSCILQFTGAKDVGTGAYEGNLDGGFGLRIFYGITPETEDTTWFFWSAANGYRQDDPQATEDLFRDITIAFKEDEDVLIAQHQRLKELSQRPLVNIRSDGARVQARMALERQLAREAGPSPAPAA